MQTPTVTPEPSATPAVEAEKTELDLKREATELKLEELRLDRALKSHDVELKLEDLRLAREQFKFEDDKRDNEINDKISIGAILDAYRVVPRLFILIYGLLVYKLYTWYTAIGTEIKTVCNEGLIRLYIESGVDPVQANELACTIAEVVGGPTTAQTTFVTTVVGLATPIFAFYASTGKKGE